MIVLQPRRTAPEHKVEYFLDCAAEAVELDTCSHLVLRLYGNDAVMAEIIKGVSNNFRERRAKCLQLAALADELLPHIPPDRCRALIRAGFHGLAYEIHGLAECLAYWGIEDEIDGGCMLPFRDRPRCRRGVTFKRTARRVRSERFIRRVVRREGPDATSHLRALTAIMLERARRWGLEFCPAAMRTVRIDCRAQLNHREVITAAKNRRQVRANRKVIFRSYSTAVSVLGRETVSAFLRGEEIRLIGQQAMLTLRKRGRLSDHGHGCLSVGMADRDGTRLADLCTFIEGTPTLDQLTGFALWMSAGAEEDILQRANIVQLEPAGRAHPLLAKRAAGQRAQAEQELDQLLGPEGASRARGLLGGSRRRVDSLSSEDRRARNSAYWEETKGEWIEAVVVMVIGYRNLHWFKQAEAL